MGSFEGQAAVVTGAGVGIGFAIAQRLAENGASVLLNDVDSALAEQAAAKITQEGGVCQSFPGDMSDVPTIRALVKSAVERFGRLDLAVANAGLSLYSEFFELTPENFNRVVGLNLRGSYFLAQAAAAQMRAQGSGGRILFMSSVTGHVANPNLAAYGMTKAGLEMLAKALVIDLAPLGITVNTVAPGATLTPRTLTMDPNFEPGWRSVTPTDKVSEPDDIASAALFLLSPHSGQITGQTIVVDGGWTATGHMPDLTNNRQQTS